MDELIYYYRKLLQLLEEEEITISSALGEALSEKYRRIIRKERLDVENNLRKIMAID